MFENMISYFGRLVTSNPRSILAAGTIIVVVGIYGLLWLNVDVNIAGFFKPGTEFRNSIDFIDQEMTGTMDIRVIVEGPIKSPELLK